VPVMQEEFAFKIENEKTMINEHCWLTTEGNRRNIYVNYAPFSCYQIGDKVNERFILASLSAANIARKTELSKTFGYHRNYITRLEDDLLKNGVAGMIESKRGPKDSWKVTPQIRKRITKLLEKSKPASYIMARIEKEFGVRITDTTVYNIKKITGITTEEKAPIIEQPVLELFDAEEKEEVQSPTFRTTKEISYAGEFLYYPAIENLGILSVFEKVYRRIKGRIYGFQETLLSLFFLTASHFKSIESFKGVVRKDFGILIGRKVAPAVKTLRRKLSWLASLKKGALLGIELAKLFVTRELYQVGVVYIDGHFKPYYGSKKVTKGYFTQRRLVHPGCTEYFINDYRGRPLFFMLVEACDSLTKVMPEIISDIRNIIGMRRFTIIFDRGGYSTTLFELLKREGVDFITYHRGWKKKYPLSKFKHKWTKFMGKRYSFLLYDTRVRLNKFGRIRTVIVMKGNHQTPIITSDLKRSAPLIAHLMFNRWGQENFFKYMTENYHLDSLCSYDSQKAEDRLVTNPLKKIMSKKIKTVKNQITELQIKLGSSVSENKTKIVNKKILKQLRQLENNLKKLKYRQRTIPKKVLLSQLKGGNNLEVLQLEKKVIIDTVKLCAYQSEQWLLQLLAKHYDNDNDIRQVLKIITQSKGSLSVKDNTITVSLNAPDIPQYRESAIGLCKELNQLKVKFPGSNLGIHYEIKEQMHTTGCEFRA